MKRLLCTALLCSLCVGLSGCGGDSSDSVSDTSGASSSLSVSGSGTESDRQDSENPEQDTEDDSDHGSSFSSELPETSDPEASTDNIIDMYHEIQDFEIIFQEPELPTGCEITAMTMVLHYYGFDVDKVTMATQYLPCMPYETWVGDDGQTHGYDLRNYFVGDPTGSGCTCGTGAITTAADTYLADAGSSMTAVDLTGASPEDLYGYVNDDNPVVVWVTIGMEDRRTPQDGWYTDDGTWVDWSSNDHGAVLIGYTNSTVTIADPLDGYEIFDREQFESVWLSRGSHAVVLE